MDLIVVIAAGQFVQKNALSHLLTDQQVNYSILKKIITFPTRFGYIPRFIDYPEKEKT